MIKDVLNVPNISIANFRPKSKLRSFAFARQNSCAKKEIRTNSEIDVSFPATENELRGSSSAIWWIGGTTAACID